MIRLSVIALTTLVMIPSVTDAQTVTPTPTTPLPTTTTPPQPQRPANAPSPYTGGAGILSEINHRNMNERARLAAHNTSPARLNRAERVAELLNAGNCAGAHTLAVQENDRRLASRIEDICHVEN